MGAISIERQISILIVKLTGLLTEDILLKQFGDIRSIINPGEKVRILYDLLEIELNETAEIALEAQHIYKSIEKNVDRVAVVLTDYLVKTRAGIAFVHADKCEVFYDFESAIKWLKTG